VRQRRSPSASSGSDGTHLCRRQTGRQSGRRGGSRRWRWVTCRGCRHTQRLARAPEAPSPVSRAAAASAASGSAAAAAAASAHAHGSMVSRPVAQQSPRPSGHEACHAAHAFKGMPLPGRQHLKHSSAVHQTMQPLRHAIACDISNVPIHVCMNDGRLGCPARSPPAASAVAAAGAATAAAASGAPAAA